MFYYKYKSVLSVLSVFETKKNSVLMSPTTSFQCATRAHTAKLFQSKWKVVLQESKSKVNCQFFAYKSFKTAFKRCLNGVLLFYNGVRVLVAKS